MRRSLNLPPPYVELHCHSAFSFLDGASSPLELADRAHAYGYRALALTDHDGIWGSMEFAVACKAADVRPITGAELTVSHGGRLFHLTLLVRSQAGYRNLCRLLTEAHAHTRDGSQRRAGQPWVELTALEGRSEGLVALSGCAGRGLLPAAWEDGDLRRGERLGRWLLERFGPEGLRIELQRPFWRHDRARNRWLSGIARRLGVATVATGNAHSHLRDRSQLQDAMVAVRLGTTLEGSEPERRGNSTSHLAPHKVIAARFRDHPEAIVESARLAESLEFDLQENLGYRYPHADNPEAARELREICDARFGERYAGGPLEDEAKGRLEAELKLIGGIGLSGFFLLHHEVLELAREVAVEVRGPDSARAALPPGRGRGSSVSSIVCYLTGLSHVDPVKAELFSGRFLNDTTTTGNAPDIDLDFPRDIREKLILRIHEKYGNERSALVAAFPTYRSKGAIRDFGKALGMPQAEIERVARTVDAYGSEMEQDLVAAIGRERAHSRRWRHLMDLCKEARNLPRHPSQHSGGMIISTDPLIDVCPVVPAAMEGRQIVQWDKDSCQDAGLLKIDLLGLGMLSAVEWCVEEIARSRGERIDLSRIPLDDEPTYEAIRAAETTGVFQIESRAQMQMLPRTRPENLDDLVVQVALVRPGPIQGGAVHPYIEHRMKLRRNPEFEIPYPHPLLERALKDTLGTIVFQEQVIEVSMDFAGFSAAEAEGLRRAMSRKRSERAMESLREKFIAGALSQGVEVDVATKVYEQIKGFSGFGFPKAHSAAFGLLAYQSTWLRVHYGPEYLAALLNEQPMGFYPPDSLVQEAMRRGIEVLPPDVNHSLVECSTEPGGGDAERSGDDAERSGDDPEPAVRIGLGYVKGVAEEDMERLVAERRRGGPYAELGQLASRAALDRSQLEKLAWAGALRSIPAGDRVTGLWKVGVLPSGHESRAGRQLTLPIAPPDAPELTEPGEWQRVVAEYGSISMTLEGHPMLLMRESLGPEVLTTTAAAQLEDGSSVESAGVVVARQRPETARGVVFLLLEDEVGTLNVVVPPPVMKRHRHAVRTAQMMRVTGTLEHRQGVVNLLARRLVPLEPGDANVKAVAPSGHFFGRRGG